jgi:hypothetical protein
LYLDFFNLLVILTLIVYGQSGGKHHNTPPTSPLEKTIIYPPTSPTAEIMDPGYIKLLQAIKAMGIKPKTDTPQNFGRSMKEYFRQKEEFDDKKPHSLTLPPDVRPKENIQPAPYQPPTINIFTGSGNKSRVHI